MDEKAKKRKISYSVLLAVFIALILLGVGGMLFRHGDLEIHKSGWSVEGTIVSYDVNYYQRGQGYGGTYKCVFKCEYRNEETNNTIQRLRTTPLQTK